MWATGTAFNNRRVAGLGLERREGRINKRRTERAEEGMECSRNILSAFQQHHSSGPRRKLRNAAAADGQCRDGLSRGLHKPVGASLREVKRCPRRAGDVGESVPLRMDTALQQGAQLARGPLCSAQTVQLNALPAPCPPPLPHDTGFPFFPAKSRVTFVSVGSIGMSSVVGHTAYCEE